MIDCILFVIVVIVVWFISWLYEIWVEIFYISMEGKYNIYVKGCVGRKEFEDINVRNI